jgi:TPR repeat protein
MNLRNLHCSKSQLAGYARRELPWRELLQVDRHLGSCEDCAGCLARRADIRRARSVLRAVVGANSHFAYEQLEELAEGKMALTGALEAHVRECHACHNELRDLRMFISSFRAATPARTSLWLDSVRRWFERPLQLAAAMAAIAAVSAGLLAVHTGLQRNANQATGSSLAARAVVVDSQHVATFAECGETELAVASAEWYALYQSGKYQELREALRRPAEAGNQIAQAALGILIATGQGAERDLDAARTWLGKAAAQGDSCARQALAAIK